MSRDLKKSVTVFGRDNLLDVVCEISLSVRKGPIDFDTHTFRTPALKVFSRVYLNCPL